MDVSTEELVKDSTEELVKDSTEELVKDSTEELVKDSTEELVKDSTEELVKDSTEELVKELVYLDPVFTKDEYSNYEYSTTCIVFENDIAIVKTFDITINQIKCQVKYGDDYGTNEDGESIEVPLCDNEKLFTRMPNDWSTIECHGMKCRRDMSFEETGVWCESCHGEVGHDSTYGWTGPEWYSFLKDKLTFDELRLKDIGMVSVLPHIMDISDKTDIEMIIEHLEDDKHKIDTIAKKIRSLKEKEEKLNNRIGSKEKLEQRITTFKKHMVDALNQEKELEKEEQIKQEEKQRKIEEIQKQIDLLQSQKEDLST